MGPFGSSSLHMVDTFGAVFYITLTTPPCDFRIRLHSAATIKDMYLSTKIACFCSGSLTKKRTGNQRNTNSNTVVMATSDMKKYITEMCPTIKVGTVNCEHKTMELPSIEESRGKIPPDFHD